MQRSVTCSFFFRNCTHILTRTQGRKFEDMFLVKIASKGHDENLRHGDFSFGLKSVKYVGGTPLGQWKQFWPRKVFFVALNTTLCVKHWKEIT